MSEAHSTPAPSGGKPAKPYPDFPLFPHAAGVWAKKIRGKLHYFGPWSDPDGALAAYLRDKDALHAGRKPRADPDALTVKDAANAYLNHKQSRVDAGQLSPRTFAGYKIAADEVVAAFGKTRLVADLAPDDFASLWTRMEKKWGLHRLATTIQYVRSIFKHTLDSGLIDKPVRFGPGFQRPTKKAMRLHRAEQGAKLFTAEEVRRLIDTAGPALRAMILLGINGGFGNSDCANLPLSALDAGNGWLDYPRPKTGINRRVPLWPETIAALTAYRGKRPEPKEEGDAGLVFLTKYGYRWSDETTTNPVSQEFAKVAKAAGIEGRRGYYTLRHTFRTIADEAKDQPACDFIMGHSSPHISSVYRERISDARLKAVTDHVRAWLFGDGKEVARE
jgi:integrase